jgi:hypothetical protein
MRQVGFQLLPGFGGEQGLVPGPATKDGVLLTPQDAEETQESLALVEAMLHGLIRYDRRSIGSMGQVNFWHPEMLWCGPCGIGTTRGLKGFEDYHQIPFLRAFPDRKGGHHKARLGDGAYAASTGWPSLWASHRGEYLAARTPAKKSACGSWTGGGEKATCW